MDMACDPPSSAPPPPAPPTPSPYGGVVALVEVPLVGLDGGPVEEVAEEPEVVARGLLRHQPVLHLAPEGKLVLLVSHLHGGHSRVGRKEEEEEEEEEEEDN